MISKYPPATADFCGKYNAQGKPADTHTKLVSVLIFVPYRKKSLSFNDLHLSRCKKLKHYFRNCL